MVSVEGFWGWLSGRNLIVLDELGCRGLVSDHHYEAVKRLLDERHGKPLIVIANTDLAGIERLYDDRVASRLSAGTVVSVAGKDRRTC